MIVSYINNANRLCYNKNVRAIDVLLGSSLPVMGGGGSMKFFKKLSVLIKLLKLIIDLYNFFK